MKKLSITFACLVVALLPALSRADADGGPEIFELVQNGQDVEITITFDDQNILKDDLYSLERSSDNGDSLIFEDRHFTTDDAVSSEDGCFHTGDPEYCEDNPGMCSDCDGDDVEECDGDCYTLYFFEFLDECVEPGLVRYFLENSERPLREKSLDVEDTGDDCWVPVDDAGPVSEADDDNEDDGQKDGDSGSSDGCSVSAAGHKSASFFNILPAVGLLLSRR